MCVNYANSFRAKHSGQTFKYQNNIVCVCVYVCRILSHFSYFDNVFSTIFQLTILQCFVSIVHDMPKDFFLRRPFHIDDALPGDKTRQLLHIFNIIIIVKLFFKRTAY